MLPKQLPTLLSQVLADDEGVCFRESQGLLAPRLAFGRHLGPASHNARRAAVLAVLMPRDHDWLLPLTIRKHDLPSHPGQICFPGGTLEDGETEQQAAVREFHEELGAEDHTPHIIGRLSPVFVFNSNFLVTPYVATLPCIPSYSPAPEEVEKVLLASATGLQDPSVVGSHVVERGPLRFSAPHLSVGGCQVWGATAIILGELTNLIRRAASLEFE